MAPATKPTRDIPLSSILNQVSQLENSDQPPALEHIERKVPGGKPRPEMPNLPAMPMLKPAPSFIPAPGDNVPLAIPDVTVPPPAAASVPLQSQPINRLWSEATDDDIENHALTIEVEKPSAEEGCKSEDNTKEEGLALFKEDLSALTPVPMESVEHAEKNQLASPPQTNDAMDTGQEQMLEEKASISQIHVPGFPSFPTDTMEETPNEHHHFVQDQHIMKQQHIVKDKHIVKEQHIMKEQHVVKEQQHIPKMPPLTSAHIPLTSSSDQATAHVNPPRTPSELSRDNELLQFAKLVDKLHSEESNMDADPPSINLDIPDSFASFADGRSVETTARTEDHSIMMHGLSPDLSQRVHEPEKVNIV